MTHDEMIAVIAAHQDGKAIESRAIGGSLGWLPCPKPTWSFREIEYRIKPKPRSWWLAIEGLNSARAFDSQSDALRFAEHCLVRLEIVHVTETSAP